MSVTNHSAVFFGVLDRHCFMQVLEGGLGGGRRGYSCILLKFILLTVLVVCWRGFVLLLFCFVLFCFGLLFWRGLGGGGGGDLQTCA